MPLTPQKRKSDETQTEHAFDAIIRLAKEKNAEGLNHVISRVHTELLRNGETPVRVLAREGDQASVDFLIERGAFIRSAFFGFAQGNHVENVLRMLAKYQDHPLFQSFYLTAISGFAMGLNLVQVESMIAAEKNPHRRFRLRLNTVYWIALQKKLDIILDILSQEHIPAWKRQIFVSAADGFATAGDIELLEKLYSHTSDQALLHLKPMYQAKVYAYQGMMREVELTLSLATNAMHVLQIAKAAILGFVSGKQIAPLKHFIAEPLKLPTIEDADDKLKAKAIYELAENGYKEEVNAMLEQHREDEDLLLTLKTEAIKGFAYTGEIFETVQLLENVDEDDREELKEHAISGFASGNYFEVCQEMIKAEPSPNLIARLKKRVTRELAKIGNENLFIFLNQSEQNNRWLAEIAVKNLAENEHYTALNRLFADKTSSVICTYPKVIAGFRNAGVLSGGR